MNTILKLSCCKTKGAIAHLNFKDLVTQFWYTNWFLRFSLYHVFGTVESTIDTDTGNNFHKIFVFVILLDLHNNTTNYRRYDCACFNDEETKI